MLGATLDSRREQRRHRRRRRGRRLHCGATALPPALTRVSLREQLGLEHPIVGAGLGGGLSRAKLTVAIAEAGGLGQLGILPPALLRAELAAHRERSAYPVAVNLLLPFARREHWEVARTAR